MVKSEKLFSPNSYVESLTGKYYIINGDNDIETIEDLLEQNNVRGLWNYPLSEIDHIVSNNLNVVLVDCMVYDEDEREFKHELRWFEVPDEWEDEDF